MQRSFLKISIMFSLINNSISFGMIIRHKNQNDHKALQGAVKRILNRTYHSIYPMTIDEVLKMVKEDNEKEKPSATIVSQKLSNEDHNNLRDLFASVNNSQALNSLQGSFFKKTMIAIAKKEYNNLSGFLLELKKSLLLPEAAVLPDNRVSLSLLMHSWAAKDHISFDMVTKMDPFNANVLALKCEFEKQYLTLLDLMVRDSRFNRQNIKTYQDNGGLSAEEVGRENLRSLFKAKDFESVKQRLLSNDYIPILFIDNSPTFIKTNESFDFLVVSPYEQAFYINCDMQCINNDQQIIKFKKEQFERHLTCALQKKVQKNKTHGEIPFSVIGDIANPLFYAVLFGDDKDIKDILKKSNETLDYFVLYDIVRVAISSPCKHNNALKLLMPMLQCLKKEIHCAHSYSLLLLAAKNKEVFQLVSRLDCYNMNRKQWRYYFESESENKTNLDRMLKDNKNFDLEHIRIFRDYGGMTSKEVEQYNDLDNTYKNIHNRQIATSVGLSNDEQAVLRDRFNDLSFAKI